MKPERLRLLTLLAVLFWVAHGAVLFHFSRHQFLAAAHGFLVAGRSRLCQPRIEHAGRGQQDEKKADPRTAGQAESAIDHGGLALQCNHQY